MCKVDFFVSQGYLVFDADNGRLAMAKAAIDHGTEHTLLEFQDEQQGGIIAIPVWTGLMPNAERADPLPDRNSFRKYGHIIGFGPGSPLWCATSGFQKWGQIAGADLYEFSSEHSKGIEAW